MMCDLQGFFDEQSMRILIRKFASVGLLAIAVSGCSGLKEYPSTGDRNLLVRTKVSGSFSTKVEAFLHVYRLQGSCNLEYLGTVELNRDEIRLGISPRQPTYLKFVFATSARFANSSSILPYSVVLTPRPDAQYTADASYVDRIYNVAVREIGPRGTPERFIERRTLDCPSSADR
jgi:hypothetical protein